MGLLEALEAALEVKESVVNMIRKTTEAELIVEKDQIEVWAMTIKGKVVLVGYDEKTEVLSARKTTKAMRDKDATFLVEAHQKGREAKVSEP